MFVELKIKLFLTNYINILGIFIAVYLACIVSELITITSVSDILASLITGFIGGGVVIYGAVFWIGAEDRRGAGYNQGMSEAADIIESLHRTGGLIDEYNTPQI